MSKITFVVIAVLVFIASVTGKKDELKVRVAEEVQEKVKALTGVNQENVADKLTALEKQLKGADKKDGKSKGDDEKEMITTVVDELKAAAKEQKDKLDDEKLQAVMKKIVDGAKTSGVSKSVPSMIVAVVVAVGVFMN